MTKSYGASYFINSGNVSEPLSPMHRVTGGDPLLFEARENVLDAYLQLSETHSADIVACGPCGQPDHKIFLFFTPLIEVIQT